MPARGIEATIARRAERRKLEALRSSPRGGAIWCGGIPLGGQASPDLLSGHGVVDLLPMAFLGLLLVAATIWMIRRWGARPPVLPPGVNPPSPSPAVAPRAGEAPAARPPAAALPAAS